MLTSSRSLLCSLILFAAMPAFAQTFSSLLSLTNSGGSNPYGTLIEGPDGDFYGTTELGGANGQGTVFKVTPTGEFNTLYSFCAQSGCTDGYQPFAGLVLASNGNFYGTTLTTAFTITPSGDLTTLYHFCSLADCADGSDAYNPLIQATDGNFYGTTTYGGAKGSCGTVFKLTPSGVLTTLQKFRLTDGCYPGSALLQANDGNFYGTTSSGGAHNSGTIFRLTPAGLFTLLFSFDGTHGAHPSSPLTQAANGKLYGTTGEGGSYGYGAIFRFTTSGGLYLVHSFDSTDGESPSGPLVHTASGTFYGTTYEGGGHSTCAVEACGTVYQFVPSGKLTTLYAFCSQSSCTDGGGPDSGLLHATDGNFYGTTLLGGTNSCGADGTCGTVFKLSLAGGSR
jgi:uncharacterized repeat protein (TIGR03803 family)